MPHGLGQKLEKCVKIRGIRGSIDQVRFSLGSKFLALINFYIERRDMCCVCVICLCVLCVFVCFVCVVCVFVCVVVGVVVCVVLVW